jgi:hypothetical protein
VLAGETDVVGEDVIDGKKGYARIPVRVILDRHNSAQVHVYHKTALLQFLVYIYEVGQKEPLTIMVCCISARLYTDFSPTYFY